jgi:hypothetical protein
VAVALPADYVDRAHPLASILESVSDSARVLLVAAVLSLTALAVFVVRLARLDGGPARLIGQLRLAQWSALALSAIGAVPIGLVIFQEHAPLGNLEITIALAFVVLAGLVLQREPRDALQLAAGGFVAHALLDIAHRPGALDPVAPHWYAVGCAMYDVCFAALCYWARRR